MCQITRSNAEKLSTDILSSHSNFVFPGQIYQVPIVISSESPFPNIEDSDVYEIYIRIRYTYLEEESKELQTNTIKLSLKVRSSEEPFKYTFMNSDSSVKAGMTTLLGALSTV